MNNIYRDQNFLGTYYFTICHRDCEYVCLAENSGECCQFDVRRICTENAPYISTFSIQNSRKRPKNRKDDLHLEIPRRLFKNKYLVYIKQYRCLKTSIKPTLQVLKFG